MYIQLLNYYEIIAIYLTIIYFHVSHNVHTTTTITTTTTTTTPWPTCADIVTIILAQKIISGGYFTVYHIDLKRALLTQR
jgi:hypothetical protein